MTTFVVDKKKDHYEYHIAVLYSDTDCVCEFATKVKCRHDHIYRVEGYMRILS
jgi:hypothetical protein